MSRYHFQHLIIYSYSYGRYFRCHFDIVLIFCKKNRNILSDFEKYSAEK